MSRTRSAVRPRPNLDPFHGRISLHLAGSFSRGGTLRVDVDGLPGDFVPLPKTQWGALALLALSVLHSDSFGEFLTSDQLALALEKRQILDLGLSQVAIRVVHRLRTTLNGLNTARKFATPSADDGETSGAALASFAKRLIAQWPTLGYRLGVPASHVTLDLQDETPRDVGRTRPR